MRFFRILTACAALALPLGHADVRGCLCDSARPETMRPQECSLCRLADAQPPGEAEFFLVHDNSPNKPNRWLAMPRSHGVNPQELSGMTAEQHSTLGTVAIRKAGELWGNDWGLAVNNLMNRTQCHLHIHIGKLGPGAENNRFVAVDTAAEIPLPRNGDGIWVHPVGAKLHVHWGEDKPELLLQR